MRGACNLSELSPGWTSAQLEELSGDTEEAGKHGKGQWQARKNVCRGFDKSGKGQGFPDCL